MKNTNDMESMKVLKKVLDENLNKGWIKNNGILADLPFDYDISITNVAGLFQLDSHYQGKYSSYNGMSNFHIQKHTSVEDGKEVSYFSKVEDANQTITLTQWR